MPAVRTRDSGGRFLSFVCIFPTVTTGCHKFGKSMPTLGNPLPQAATRQTATFNQVGYLTVSLLANATRQCINGGTDYGTHSRLVR